MPKYNSKTQSKNGGRRRKQTKRKMRRGRKSRKVMRGGGAIRVAQELTTKLKQNLQIRPELIRAFALSDDSTDKDIFDAICRKYGGDSIFTNQVVSQPGPIMNNPNLVNFFNTAFN